MFKQLRPILNNVSFSDLLGDTLFELGYITKKELQRALKYQKSKGVLLGDALKELGILESYQLEKALSLQRNFNDFLKLLNNPEKAVDFLEENVFFKKGLGDYIAYFYNIEWVDLNDSNISPDLLNLFNIDFLEKNNILPYTSKDKTIYFATNKIDVGSLDVVLRRELGSKYDYEFHFAFEHDLKIQFKMLSDDNNFVDKKNEEFVVNWVKGKIQQGLDLKASDIHFEPLEFGMRIRYRIDGELSINQSLNMSKEFRNTIISRLKIMTDGNGMQISERRRPQDGSIKNFEYRNKKFDFRLSSIITNKGEKIVMRINPHDNNFQTFEDLGFDEELVKKLKNIIQSPYGILYIAGATGSGKTTTQYAMLDYLNDDKVNINSVEDPIERNIQGINQTQINEKAGITFAGQLRALLRQDPDIIMVGEIRDVETAKLAVRASLTGHIVITTIHSNDSVSTMSRLIDMGVKEHLLGVSSLGFLSQRLARKLCPHCKTKKKLSPLDIKWLEKYSDGVDIDEVNFYEPVGCEKCNQIGYKGRIAITEFVEVDDEVKEMISNKASVYEIRQKLKAKNVKTLKDSAISKVIQGITTISEIEKNL